MEMKPIISLLDKNDHFEKVLKRYKSLKILSGLNKTLKLPPLDYFIISDTENLENLKKFNTPNNRGLLIKTDPDNENMIFHLLNTLNLSKISKNLLSFCNSIELERILHAWSIGAQSDLIAKAKIVENNFFIESCDFKKMFIPIHKILKIKKMSKKDQKDFSLDKHGSFLYWKKSDIHLDLESFKLIQNPKLRADLLKKKIAGKKRLGNSIRALRKNVGLTQKEIGLSEKQIRRYELGEIYPSYKAYQTMAKAHGMNVDQYIEELSNLKN